MNKRVVALLILSGVVAVVTFVLAGVWLRTKCYGGDDLCPGIRVGGQPLAVNADPDGLLGERAQQLARQPLELTVEGVPDVRRVFTLGELGIVLDVGRTVSLVRAVGHLGTHIDRFADARRAARGEIDVPPVVNVDEETARAAVMALKDETDELPIPARLDLAHGGIVAEVPGHFLDVEDAFERIRGAALSGASSVELRRLSVVPRVSRDFLQAIDHRERLARFQTGFSRHGDQELRAHNIETAAARLDGVVLLPQELFSFNTIVGPRTAENGFSKGWEIFKGEMVEGIGGGTCQVASTFHAAVLLAGLDVIERLPHSRPSAYITMGLDATVVYPVVDLKVRNPYDFPIVVHSYVEGNTVFFELLGRERPAHVTFRREVLATRPYTRKIEEMAGLPSDRIIRKQHGIRGYKIRRTRTIAYRDGTQHEESNVDTYWPTIEMYLVAPGMDAEALLPPLPENESGHSSWSPLEESENPAPAEAVSASLAAVAPSGSLSSSKTSVSTVPTGASTACTGDCPPDRPKITEAPGVHPPRAEQLRVPTKVIIGSGRP
ncbi:MAG TPA: VanW family protein [Polyangiaceae bacterium]